MQHIARLVDPPASSWAAAVAAAPPARYELRFRPLAEVGCGFAFPCDASGKVLLDGLGRRSLANYLYARAVVGHELQWPQVERVA